jgi:hypothetical protein
VAKQNARLLTLLEEFKVLHDGINFVDKELDLSILPFAILWAQKSLQSGEMRSEYLLVREKKRT